MSIPPPRPRPGRTKQRRGRGPRGPFSLPGAYAPDGAPGAGTRAEQFDDLVLDVVERLARRHPDETAGTEFAVEDHPVLSTTWVGEVPLGTVADGTGGRRRVVVFRRPVTTRAQGREELRALVTDVVVEQAAIAWARSPDDVDPRT